MRSSLRALRATLRVIAAHVWATALIALAAWPACAAPREAAPTTQAQTAGDASAAAAQSAASAAAVSPSVLAAVAAQAASEQAGLVMVFNRPVVRFYAPLPGVTIAVRAQRAQEEAARLLKTGGPGVVGTSSLLGVNFVMIDGASAFPLLPEDLVHGQTLDGVVAALQLAVKEHHEATSLGLMLRATGFALLATLVLVGAALGLRRTRSWFGKSLTRLGRRHSARLALGGMTLLDRDRVVALARAITSTTYYLLVFFLASEWLGVVLRLFPYTRRWGEQLDESEFTLAADILRAIASSLPGLAMAVVIFLIARGVLGLAKPFFAQVERGEVVVGWLDRDTVRATRSLVSMAVWLFALAMAYPYLPGSDSEAFKGISVLLGVMLSIGSSNFVGQGISGLILIYSHTLRVGEYVRIGDVEGTVTQMKTFAVRIRTGMGEELTLPNTLIVGSVTKNYSRAVKGAGFIVDTVLTIGYDTPWRQVHAMMIDAARRTEGILATPAPQVFQTALSDFYVEYRLVAQAHASEPRPRAQVLADLHANLQDVFNENGVQIMSPHYLGDPAEAKIVPPAKWNPPTLGKR
jgi:small-conductance mechanosensitive channel